MRHSLIRFRLAHLGLAIALFSLALGWLAYQRRIAASEAQALQTVQRMGGIYDSLPSPAWRCWLVGHTQHLQLSIRMSNLGQNETWGPYGPGGALVRIHDWQPASFHKVGAALQTLQETTSLSFQGTRITGHADQLIPHSQRLTYLSLEQTGVRADELKAFRRTPNLQRLSLRRTPLTDMGLGYVEELEKLELLDVSSTDITDGALACIARLPKLKILRLENTKVTDEGLQALRHQRGLQELDLGLTLVSPASLTVLGKLRVTDRLVVPNDWPDEDLEHLQRLLPGCGVSRSPYYLTDRSKARQRTPASRKSP